MPAKRPSPLKNSKIGPTAGVVTGGGAGAGLAGIAQSFSEPYRTWISVAAPAVAAVVAIVWPAILNEIGRSVSTALAERARRRAIRVMDQYIAAQHRRLADAHLDGRARAQIEKHLAEVQLARVDEEHSIVAIYAQPSQQ